MTDLLIEFWKVILQNKASSNLKIDINHPVETVFGHIQEGRYVRDPCTVDQQAGRLPELVS